METTNQNVTMNVINTTPEFINELKKDYTTALEEMQEASATYTEEQKKLLKLHLQIEEVDNIIAMLNELARTCASTKVFDALEDKYKARKKLVDEYNEVAQSFDEKQMELKIKETLLEATKATYSRYSRTGTSLAEVPKMLFIEAPSVHLPFPDKLLEGICEAISEFLEKEEEIEKELTKLRNEETEHKLLLDVMTNNLPKTQSKEVQFDDEDIIEKETELRETEEKLAKKSGILADIQKLRAALQEKYFAAIGNDTTLPEPPEEIDVI